MSSQGDGQEAAACCREDTEDMNRGRAETYLRQLAEAELRSAAAPGALSRGAGRLPLVAQALVAAGAADVGTAGQIQAELDLALAARYHGGRTKVRCRYQLIIDTTHLQQAIPDVWVISPPDGEIKHVNIWPSRKSFCKWSGTWLPSVCWYTYANGWLAAPAKSRTLGAALEYVKQLLNTENNDSPAR